MALPNLATINKLAADVSTKVAGKYNADTAAAEANAAISDFKRQFNLSETDSKTLLSALTYGEGQKKGLSQQQVYNQLPPQLKDTLVLSPENLQRAQDITIAGTKIQIGAIVAGGVAAAVAAFLGAPLLVVGGIVSAAVAVMYGAGAIVNNYNDAFTHGVNYLAQATAEAEKLNKPGITQFGSITEQQFKDLFEGWKRLGVTGISNPIRFSSQLLTLENVKSSMRDFITDLNAKNVFPTIPEAIRLYSAWLIKPPGSPAAKAEAAAVASGTTPGTTRVTSTKSSKPQVFIGTLFSGRVASDKVFDRLLDDQITDLEDLRNDAQQNLNKWIASLPGRLIYSINVQSSPFDENGIKQNGFWVTLSIGYRRIAGSFVPLDTILLGPIDPIVYFPRPTETKQIQIELPAGISAQEVMEIELPGGELRIFDKSGTPINVPFAESAGTPAREVSSVAAPAAAPATAPAPTPQPPPVSQPAPAPVQQNHFFMYWPAARSYYIDGQLVPSSVTRSDALAAARGRFPNIQDTGDTSAPTGETGRIQADADAKRAAGISTIIPSATVPSAAPVAPSTGTFPRNVTVSAPEGVFVRSAPNTSASLAGSQRLSLGTTFTVTNVVVGQSVEGEARWWVSQFGNFVWVGGTREKP